MAALAGEASPLAVASAHRAEHAADREKFVKLLENLQARDYTASLPHNTRC